MRERTLDLLERAAAWLDGLTDASGRRICARHGVEHVGKTAYRVHLGLALAAERGVALDETVRTAVHLAKTCHKYPHPEARAYLFFERWPDPWNCSNHLIDTGAACDALGRLLIEAPDALTEEQRDTLRAALEQSASTYLWAASVDKPVSAQCLWGALGMARASVALGREDLADQARAALARTYETLRDDGSWSYYTGGGEPGSEDASAFYHSRCVGFALETLALVGDDPAAEPHRSRLTAALEFLLALHRADGRKCRAWEAKLWYFDGDTETASLPFDVHALLLGARAFDDARYVARATRSLELLHDAQQADGHLSSGPAPAFQCPTFWTAHLGLLANVLDLVPDPPSGEAGDATPGTARAAAAAPVPDRVDALVLPDAGLGRLERDGRVVLVRGRRPAPSPGFGGYAGGGARVADGTASRERSTWTSPNHPERLPAGELVAPGAAPRAPFRPHGLAWLKFSRWRWRCELRANGPAAALGRALRTLGELRAWRRPDAASHLCLDATLAIEDEALVVTGALAAADGRPVPGTRTRRRYAFEGSALVVEESLACDPPLARVDYRLPPGASDVTAEGGTVADELVTARAVRALAIRYRLEQD